MPLAIPLISMSVQQIEFASISKRFSAVNVSAVMFSRTVVLGNQHGKRNFLSHDHTGLADSDIYRTLHNQRHSDQAGIPPHTCVNAQCKQCTARRHMYYVKVLTTVAQNSNMYELSLTIPTCAHTNDA